MTDSDDSEHIPHAHFTDAGATTLVSWRLRRGRAPKLVFRCAAPGAKLGRCA